MSSMFSGVSGLRSHQTKMDVIAHNISNVNTAGYKSSRVTFSEVFSQTITSATSSSSETGRGGTNPMQVGLGSGVASIDKVMTQGSAQRTDKATDLMIQGDGFFVVGDNSGQYFSRAGALDIDAHGNLINAQGLRVYGWDASVDPQNPGVMKVDRGTVNPIVISGTKQYIVPETTKNIKLSGNLNSAEHMAGNNKFSTISFFDSLGNEYTLDMEFRYITEGDEGGGAVPRWEYFLSDRAYLNGQRTSAYEVEFAAAAGETPATITLGARLDPEDTTPPGWLSDGADPPVPVPIGSFEFGTNALMSNLEGAARTREDDPPGNARNPFCFDLRVDGFDLIPASVFGAGSVSPEGGEPGTPGTIRIDFSELRQFGLQTSTATSDALDGNGPGELQRMSIGTDGVIVGGYSNGKSKILGQIPVALFRNPGGLEKVGNNLFIATANSGTFDGVGQDITASGGQIRSGVLEMANVDLSAEFTEMITTQRGFQANSRTITTSDDMLQELVNLKR